MKLTTKNIAIIGVLTAVEIVLARFVSINTPFVRIGVAFLPVVLAGIMYGPIGGMLVSGIGDIIGATLFPSGPFFFGFTLNAIVIGAIWGIFMYKKPGSGPESKQSVIIRAAIASILIQCGIALFVTPLWIHMLYGSAYKALIITRIPQIAILTPANFFGALLMKQIAPRLKKVI